LEAAMMASAGILAGVLNASFYGISLVRGNHWVLSNEELFQCSTSITTAVHSSFPESWLSLYEENLKKYGVWVGVGITLGSIVQKRLQADREIELKGKNAGSVGRRGNGRDAASAGAPGADYDAGGIYQGEIPLGN
jgi:hypothetical protein